MANNIRLASHVLCRNALQNHLKFNKQIAQCNRRLLSNAGEKSIQSNTSTRPYIKYLAAVGAVGSAYMVYDYMKRKRVQLNYKEPIVITRERLPNVPITHKIFNSNDTTNLNLMLVQCQTCPFCCKMLAYLDSKGFSYSVVDVDEPFERRMKWSHYKNVPCVLARTKEGKYVELTNSTVIISILTAILNDPEMDVEELAKLYPRISYVKENGIKKFGIVNNEEYRWRDWADHQFIHMLYPNIYRTHAEALETYNWFAELAKWDEDYPRFITNLMIYAGATYMFLLSKRLKKLHHLSDDVRSQFYEVCNKWTEEIKKLKTKFHGGNTPDLADLAVFGALNSIQGCQTFKDVMEHTEIEPWFLAMKENAEKNKGIVVL